MKDEGLANAEDKQHLMDTAMQTAMPVVNKDFKKYIAHDLISHTHHPRVHTILDKNMLERDAMQVTEEAATEAERRLLLKMLPRGCQSYPLDLKLMRNPPHQRIIW